jgi:hypothetical protein
LIRRQRVQCIESTLHQAGDEAENESEKNEGGENRDERDHEIEDDEIENRQ